MIKEYFGKTFCGPYLTTHNIVNTGGVYLITPIIQTGSLHILDVGQTDNLVSKLNNPEMIKYWYILSREFGGFAAFVHYEINPFNRNEIIRLFENSIFIINQVDEQINFSL